MGLLINNKGGGIEFWFIIYKKINIKIKNKIFIDFYDIKLISYLFLKNWGVWVYFE